MTAPYRLAQRTSPESTIVRAGGAVFGDGGFTLVAGPCSVETAEQMDAAAAGVRAAGAAMLRGGAYKPRTSPYDFQGLGDEGLPLLADAARAAGIPAVTEVLSELAVPLVAAYAAMLQIGARNMQNVPLLRAAARTGLPILLKRGPAATLDELLGAAEYILVAGNPNVVLCERGIRGFDRHTRNVADIGAAVRLKELTHLPVIFDPSHSSGVRALVEPLSLAAAAAGLDGLIVEVHPHPEESRCDRAQAIDLADFTRLAARARAIRAVLSTGDGDATLAAAARDGGDARELCAAR